MKIREMTIGVSRTFNLGNYENFRVEASAIITLDEDEGATTARECAIEEVRASLNATYLALKPRREKNE